MKSVISIGNQDFISIRKNNCFYIDKTDFIREWWESGQCDADHSSKKIRKDSEYEYDRVFLFSKLFRYGTVF